MNIQMVDLKNQYLKLKSEIDAAVLEVLDYCAYINGLAVKSFQQHFSEYLDAKHVIPCANGTDSLQIAMMALGFEPGDEIICPAFTYISTAEVIALLRLKPVIVDVDYETFNITRDTIEAAITDKTKAIVPVNLFGQSCDMEPIVELAEANGLYVIEDNAQAIGADYTFDNGRTAKTGTLGHIGSTSFYPSKNLGAYGDGGALYTNDDAIAEKLRMVANHGQRRRYYHDVVGVNSRLDSIQAAILDIKLRHLDQYASARRRAADYYDQAFADIRELTTPRRHPKSTHVFHQYTLKVTDGRRDELHEYLKSKNIPNVIYYPVPLYAQEAFREHTDVNHLPVTEQLCKEVISLPMHTELTEQELEHITTVVKSLFQKKKKGLLEWLGLK